jgi:hypothetical protein
MDEIKTSALLTQLIEDAKAVGNRKNPPFTAERFFVAIIDKVTANGQDRANVELFSLGALIKKLVGDLDAAKKSLMEYVCRDVPTPLMDALYMKKRMMDVICS